jgi:hypothetical protein
VIVDAGPKMYKYKYPIGRKLVENYFATIREAWRLGKLEDFEEYCGKTMI